MGDSYSKPSSTTPAIEGPRLGLKYNPVYKIDLDKNCIVNFGTNAE
jgi:hypothetical protein